MSQPRADTPRKLPGDLDANRRLDRWLRINTDGTVTVFPGKVEIGQGILTAFAQIVAEELDVALDRIRLAPADTRYSPDEGVTSGSQSITGGGVALRYASAEARDLLLQRAATRLGVSLEQLSVADGVVSARSGGSVSYWDLASDDLLARDATAEVPPKPASQHTIIGASAPRRDIPAKVSGTPIYVHDLDLPGMLHGRIARAPGYGARLLALDASEVRALPGVVALVQDGSFVGVVAEREEQAVRAQGRVKRLASWGDGNPLPATMDPRFLLGEASEDQVISEKHDAEAAARTVKTLEAEYSRPYIAHAALGPSCAVARYDDGRYMVWTHSQGIYPLRGDLSAALGVDREQITVMHMDGAGCYGHNGADDVALDAALLARAVPGRPVRVQWMREDEFKWEPYGPAMVVRMRAELDASGTVVHWAQDIWSNPHSTRPTGKGGAANLLAAWHLERPVPPAPPRNPPLPGGGSHRNAIPIYVFPNERVTNRLVKRIPVRVSALRGLGATANVFAIESFMDELAAAAGADPVAFRLKHLQDPRARAVIETVASNAGWRSREKGDGVRGRGIGFARYKNSACYVGVIAEVEVERAVTVTRVWAAIDAGLTINPNGLVNQTEGGILQTVSWALKEAVQFDAKGILTSHWDDYPILGFEEVPEVKVAVVNRPELPPLGAGEGAQGPTVAAIANAIYSALGVRLRDMPFTRERVLAALNQ